VDSTSSTIVVGSECSSCLFLPCRCVENSYIIRPLDVRQTPWVGGPGGRLSDTPVPDPPSGFTDTPKPTPPATLSALPSLLRASSTIADSRRLSALRHCPEVGRGQSARWVRSASDTHSTKHDIGTCACRAMQAGSSSEVWRLVAWMASQSSLSGHQVSLRQRMAPSRASTLTLSGLKVVAYRSGHTSLTIYDYVGGQARS